MNRKILIVFVIPLFFICFFFHLPKTIAQNKIDNNITLSDAVTADLAVKGYMDNVSISYDDNNPANTVAINEKKHWIPASTVKLFTAMYVYKQIADHKLNLWDTVIADQKNVVPTELVTDELPTIQSGDRITIEKLIRQMVTQSDNTAFNQLLDVLDRQKITQYIHDLGLDHSAIGSKLNLDTSQEQYEFDTPGYGINTTTADDYTNAFLLIKNNKIAGAKDLFEILKQQKINNMLPLLLPKDVTVAHKTGDLLPLFHDGGIIISSSNNLNYVLSIFSNVGDPNIVAHLSQLIYSKDYDLVGKTANIPSTPPDKTPPMDPLLTQAKGNMYNNVLGANIQNIQTQPITAADLGITAKDLSLTMNNKTLPHVFISSDSPFHFLVPTWQFLKKTVAFTPEAKTQADLDTLSLQIAEAKQQKDKGNTEGANQIFQHIQSTLITLAHTKTVENSPSAQNTLQAASETRFSILGEELTTANKTQRIKLIKEIATQAKSTLKDVQPYIPEASNTTNPSQKPLIGQIVQVSGTVATIKTSGGQEITIPINNPTIKIQSKESSVSPSPIPETQVSITPSSSTPVPSNAPLQIGTTIALVGSSNGKTFTPSFILTNIPKELVAPQPVTVVKVDTKNKTMVISENGIPVQVNITKQTLIKGTDTSVSLNAIKPGDIVVVHGDPVVSSTPSQPSPIPQSTISVVPTTNSSNHDKQTNNQQITTIPSQSISSQNNQTTTIPTSTTISSTKDSKGNPATPAFHSIQPAASNNNITKTNASSNNNNAEHNTSAAAPAVAAPAIPAQQQKSTTIPSHPKSEPHVIQSTSIQVIEKAQDVKANPPAARTQTPPQVNKPSAQPQQSAPQAQPKPQTNSAPAAQSQPQPQTQSSQQSTTTQKEEKKAK